MTIAALEDARWLTTHRQTLDRARIRDDSLMNAAFVNIDANGHQLRYDLFGVNRTLQSLIINDLIDNVVYTRTDFALKDGGLIFAPDDVMVACAYTTGFVSKHTAADRKMCQATQQDTRDHAYRLIASDYPMSRIMVVEEHFTEQDDTSQQVRVMATFVTIAINRVAVVRHRLSDANNYCEICAPHEMRLERHRCERHRGI